MGRRGESWTLPAGTTEAERRLRRERSEYRRKRAKAKRSTKQVAAYCNEDLHLELKECARREGVSMSCFLRAALRRHLAYCNSKAPVEGGGE